MPLSENEMKQIEQDARKYVADSWNVSEEVINLECTHVMLRYEGYIAGATAQAEKYQSEIEQLKLEIKILRRESRDVDIDYNLHEGKGENNELL